jgi:hypothetical protein
MGDVVAIDAKAVEREQLSRRLELFMHHPPTGHEAVVWRRGDSWEIGVGWRKLVIPDTRTLYSPRLVEPLLADQLRIVTDLGSRASWLGAGGVVEAIVALAIEVATADDGDEVALWVRQALTQSYGLADLRSPARREDRLRGYMGHLVAWVEGAEVLCNMPALTALLRRDDGLRVSVRTVAERLSRAGFEKRRRGVRLVASDFSSSSVGERLRARRAGGEAMHLLRAWLFVGDAALVQPEPTDAADDDPDDQEVEP